MYMAAAVAAALAEVEITPADAAAVLLAGQYAERIDDYPDKLDMFGPKLLAVLDALRLTPKARSSVVKGVATGDRIDSPADQLRARRAARANGAAPMDSPAS